MDRYIKVTGYSSLSVKPDKVEINLNIVNVDEDYSKVVNDSRRDSAILLEQLTKIARLSRKNIKTEEFLVTPFYENQRDKDGNYERVFKGYKSSNGVIITLSMRDNLLNSVIDTILKLDFKPEFRISYLVSNLTKLKDKLLKEAVDDSKRKADIIASSADVKLDTVNIVDESINDTFGSVEPMVARSYTNNETLDPKDISLSYKVEVTYSIK